MLWSGLCGKLTLLLSLFLGFRVLADWFPVCFPYVSSLWIIWIQRITTVLLWECVILNVLLITFCVSPEPWRTWKIIPLSSPPWDPSTTSFHSAWRGCLGWPHRDRLKAPCRFSTSRGCRWGVLSLAMPAASLHCAWRLLLIPGIRIDLIKIWPFFLKLIFM